MVADVARVVRRDRHPARGGRCTRPTPGPSADVVQREKFRDVEVVVAEVERVLAGERVFVVEAERRPRATARRVALLTFEAIEAGRDHREPHLVAERVVDDRTEDDVGVGVRSLADDLRGFVQLEQAEVGRAADVEQDPARAFDARLEQRARDRARAPR